MPHPFQVGARAFLIGRTGQMSRVQVVKLLEYKRGPKVILRDARGDEVEWDLDADRPWGTRSVPYYKGPSLVPDKSETRNRYLDQQALTMVRQAAKSWETLDPDLRVRLGEAAYEVLKAREAQ